MATNFSYATEEELNKYYNKSSDYDNKSLLSTGWTSLGNNRYISYDVGKVQELYRNGARMHNISDSVTGTTDSTATATALDIYTDEDTTLFNTVTVDSATDFPAGTYGIFGSTERFLVTSVSSNDLTILRAQGGTSLTAHAIDTAVTTLSRADEDGQWFQPYNEATDNWNDYVVLYSSTDPNDCIMEKGTDTDTFMNQVLTDASLELHNYLDARYAVPIEKQKQIDIDTAINSATAEYDPIIIKSVCYIATANLIRAKEGASEEADYFMSLVTNVERTGLIDKLNDGIYKLSFEVDDKDKNGKIVYRVDTNGSMDLVELAGVYSGEKYDRLKIAITTGGNYGTAKFTVSYLSNDQLEGATTGAETITGGLQHIYNGLYGRFTGTSANTSDYWIVEVYDSQRKQTNKSNSTIEMTR